MAEPSYHARLGSKPPPQRAFPDYLHFPGAGGTGTRARYLQTGWGEGHCMCYLWLQIRFPQKVATDSHTHACCHSSVAALSQWGVRPGLAGSWAQAAIKVLGGAAAL